MMYKIIKALIFLSLFLMGITVMINDAFSAETFPQSLTGTILINVMGSEYAFSLSTHTMQKIPRDKIVLEEKDGRRVWQSLNYRHAWNKIRSKQYLDDEQFGVVFGGFDTSGLYPLALELNRNRHNDCDTKKTYKLSEKSPIQPQSENFTKYDHTPSRFSINDQKSFAVYTYTRPALLIDLSTMTITNAFCNKPVYKPVWDRTGQYLAHVTTTPTSNEYDELIAVTDIRNASVVMEKRINKHIEETLIVYDESSGKPKFKQWNPSTRKLEEAKSVRDSDKIFVSDIAWNPSSDHIAILTHKSRMGYWPWQLLAAAAGHGIFYESFFLSVYDMKGKELLNRKIVSDVKHGRGSLVWTDK